MGVMKRKGQMRAWVVPNVRRKTVLPKIWENVERGSTMYTDSSNSYSDLRLDYLHEIVNHAYEYVRGNAHTNNMECFWNLLQRAIGGTYTHVSPEHLQRYLDAQLFRFNERDDTDGTRFIRAAKRADGRRLTWAGLTGKD